MGSFGFLERAEMTLRKARHGAKHMIEDKPSEQEEATTLFISLGLIITDSDNQQGSLVLKIHRNRMLWSISVRPVCQY